MPNDSSGFGNKKSSLFLLFSGSHQIDSQIVKQLLGSRRLSFRDQIDSQISKVVVEQSLGSCQAVSRQSSGSHQAVIRQSSGGRTIVVPDIEDLVLE